jgi:hypothetical protein
MSEKKCSSCGASIDVNAMECKYCGETIGGQAQQYNDPQNQPENIYTENTYSGDTFTGNAYLKPYYKEEFAKISESKETYKGKWNWCAFFFTWIWAFTKGLWGLALLTLVVNISLVSVNISWISIIISVFLGLRGNYYYYNLQKNKTQFPKKS